MLRLVKCSLVVLASTLALGCGDGEGGGAKATGGVGGTAGVGGAAGSGGTAGSSGVLQLAPGEVAEVAVADGQSGIELGTPNGDEKFVIVLESNDLDASNDTFSYSLSLGAAPANASGAVVTGCSLTSDTWSKKQLTPETPPSGTAATVGDTKNIDVPLPTGSQTISAKALAVGKYAVVWADADAEASLKAGDVQDFLTDYENVILPRERAIFGVESDLDKDGHISLVFSALTYQTAVAFFTGCDLKSQFGCPSSNQGEYLYVTPPNAIQPPYNTPNAIKEILAHESGHMIHFNRKVLKNNLSDWAESMYMDEGVGAFAQDVSGFQAGNLYVTMAGLDGIDSYSLGETIVDSVQYDLNNDGVLRGGSYLFVRWFYDRAGGDEALGDGSIVNKGGPALFRTLLDAPESIAKGLPAQAGSSIEDLAADFWTTLAMSNRDVPLGSDPPQAAPKNPCFAYLPAVNDPVTTRQRGANLHASFHGMQMTGPKVQNASDADGSLRAGGGEIIELDAQPLQATVAFTLSVDAAAKSRVRVGRIQ